MPFIPEKSDRPSRRNLGKNLTTWAESIFFQPDLASLGAAGNGSGSIAPTRTPPIRQTPCTNRAWPHSVDYCLDGITRKRSGSTEFEECCWSPLRAMLYATTYIYLVIFINIKSPYNFGSTDAVSRCHLSSHIKHNPSSTTTTAKITRSYHPIQNSTG